MQAGHPGPALASPFWLLLPPSLSLGAGSPSSPPSPGRHFLPLPAPHQVSQPHLLLPSFHSPRPAPRSQGSKDLNPNSPGSRNPYTPEVPSSGILTRQGGWTPASWPRTVQRLQNSSLSSSWDSRYLCISGSKMQGCWVCEIPESFWQLPSQHPSSPHSPPRAHPWLSLSPISPGAPTDMMQPDRSQLRGRRQEGDIITASLASIQQEAQSWDPGDPNPM